MSQSNEKERTVTFVSKAEETLNLYLNKQLYTVEPGGEVQIPVSLIRYVKDRGFPIVVKGEKSNDKPPTLPEKK